jgi:uncharacterized protein YkwD
MNPNTSLARMGRATIADTVDYDLLSDMVIGYINLYRAKYHLDKLMPTREATRAAYWMADYQSRTGIVGHVSDIPGMSLFPERYRHSGGQSYAYGVENAGWCAIIDVYQERNRTYDEVARRIVDNWVNSPEHRKNLLATADESYGVVGLGLCRGKLNGFDGLYATMDAFFIWPGAALGYTANNGQ